MQKLSSLDSNAMLKFCQKHGLTAKVAHPSAIKVFRKNCPVCVAYPYEDGWEAIALFGDAPASARGETALETIAPLVVVFNIYINQLCEV